MIAIYKGNTCINIVTVEAFMDMTNVSLVGTVSEYVTCSLIN